MQEKLVNMIKRYNQRSKNLSKKRAEKTGRNISKNTAVVIPAHNIPAFKPSKTFANSVKQNVPIV